MGFCIKKAEQLYTFFAIFLLVSFNVFGQSDLMFSVSPIYSIPLGTSSEIYQFGIGGDLEVSKPIYSESLAAFGNLQYSNISLQSGAGSMNLVLLGGGAKYVPYTSGIFSASVFAGAGGYLGFYSDNPPLVNPYVSTGLSLDFALSESFKLGIKPAYKNLIAKRDGKITSFYTSSDVTIQVSFNPSNIGSGNRRPKLKIQSPDFYQVFPVIYKYYDKHPIGSVTLKNEEKTRIKDVQIEFLVPQYMEGPRVIAVIPEMKPGEEVTVPITALFRNDILQITEKDSVQALISAEYSVSSATVTAKRNESLKIYDRNSINWNDTRKAAAFITAKDPTILKFARNVTSEVAKKSSRVINQNLTDGIAIFEALRKYGIEYKVDPDSSYAQLSENETATDYLQFPVQTLDYQTGDCDDMSILYSSMLEAVSVETAFITTPGHIYIAFNLGLNKKQAQRIFSNTENIIFMEGKGWIPVEVTALKSGFLKAWNLGAREWREAESIGKTGFFPIRKAWVEYEPTWFGSEENKTVASRIPDSRTIVNAYKNSMEQFTRMQISPLVAKIEDMIKKRPSARLVNRLGTIYATYGMLDKAKRQFSKAAQSNYVPALVNLGNISYLNGKYSDALKLYQKAYRYNPDSTAVLLAVARAQFELEKYPEAREYYKQAELLDPMAASKFAYIGGSGGSNGRAADANERLEVLWADE